MAATGFTPIQLYRTSTPSATPTAGNLADGELAINTADGKLFYKDSGGVVQTLANKNVTGTVTSVGQTFTGGLISVGGSPVTSSGTLALTVAGTSGGIPYFSSASTWASSGALAANALVIGGGAGASPATTTTGTGVLTALGVNVGSAGAFTTNNAANTFTAAQTFRAANAVRSEAASTQDAIVLAGRAGGTGSFAVTFTPTTLSANRTLTLPDASGTILQSGTAVTVAQGGTGITSGTSGGVPYFSGSTTIASSAALTANAIVIGGGAGAAPSTTTTGSGVLTALGNAANATGGFATINGTATLTNKRIDPRVSSTSSTSSITPDISSFDQYAVTAQSATLTINAPTGTPVDGNKLIFRILDNGVSQTLSWNATYTVIGTTLPTATTAGKMTYVGCIYNAANTRWDVVAVNTQA